MGHRAHLHRSRVDMGDDGRTGHTTSRTSSQMWIGTNASSPIQQIAERVADLMRLDRNIIHNVSESIQLLYYTRGSGHVAGHYDCTQMTLIFSDHLSISPMNRVLAATILKGEGF